MGHITHAEKTAFNQLLIVDVLRGKHSTGVALIGSGGEVDVFKKAVNSMDFLDFKTYADLTKYSNNCMLGHNRYATKGAVNNVNAHPFEFDNVVGMHNGTLRSYTQLKDSRDFDVDSECLYNHLDEHSVQDTVDKITGAYALTWFDKRTNKLHFLRNNERPLCYCYSKDGTAMFWASEPWMLHAVLGRNNIEYQNVLIVTPDVLYSFDVPKVFATANVKLDAPKVCKMVKTPAIKKQSNASNVTHLPAVKKQPTGQPTFAHYINKEIEFCVGDEVEDQFKTYYIEGFIFNDTAKDVRIYCPKGSELATLLMAKRDLGNFKGNVRRVSKQGSDTYLLMDLRSVEYVEDLWDEQEVTPRGGEDVVKGFQGATLNMAEFNDATRKGCLWCGDHVEFGNLVHFVETDEFVCSTCHAQEEVIEYLTDGYFSTGGM